MRKRPIKEELEKNFIEHAVADKVDNRDTEEDLHLFVVKEKWPIDDRALSPSLAKGSNLRKPINLPLKEYEWNSLERHTKSLGVQKTEWIRYAIFKLMYEEQMFFKNK